MKILTAILALALAGCGGNTIKPDGSGTVETTTIGPTGGGSVTGK